MRLLSTILFLFLQIGFLTAQLTDNSSAIAADGEIVPYFVATNQCESRASCGTFEPSGSECYFTSVKFFGKFDVSKLYKKYPEQSCKISFDLKVEAKGMAIEGIPKILKTGDCLSNSSLTFIRDPTISARILPPGKSEPGNTCKIFLSNTLTFQLNSAQAVEGGICIVLVTMDPRFEGEVAHPEVTNLQLTVGGQLIKCQPTLTTMDYCGLECFGH